MTIIRLGYGKLPLEVHALSVSDAIEGAYGEEEEMERPMMNSEMMPAETTSSTAPVVLRPDVKIQDWGLIPYADALRNQMDLVALVHQELARETLVFCSHPPVVTLGRATRPDDLCGWTGEVVEISRGGRATYHGPNQIVVYPVLDLNQRGRDLHRYMRDLEMAIILTLEDFGIQAMGRSMQTVDEEIGPVEASGVWIGSRKIASIGIGVRKWVSFHGIALNIEHDPEAFKGLKPCGFSAETMTSMEEVLGAMVDRQAVTARLRQHLVDLFQQKR